MSFTGSPSVDRVKPSVGNTTSDPRRAAFVSVAATIKPEPRISAAPNGRAASSGHHPSITPNHNPDPPTAPKAHSASQLAIGTISDRSDLIHVSPRLLSIFIEEVQTAYQAGLDKGRSCAVKEIAYLTRKEYEMELGSLSFERGSGGGGGEGGRNRVGSGGGNGNGNGNGNGSRSMITSAAVHADGAAGSGGARAAAATSAGTGMEMNTMGATAESGYQATLNARRARRRLQALNRMAPY